MRIPIANARVARLFNQIAAYYDHCAFVQQEIAQRLIAKLDLMRTAPQTVVDIGTGTGLCLGLLQQRFPSAILIGVDHATKMLAIARKHYPDVKLLRSDAEQLALNPNSIDLVVSNLSLHWCGNHHQALQAITRALKPNGLLLFTVPGPDTLLELRQSWACASGVLHESPFIDMHDWGDALLAAKLSDPVVEMERLTLNYATISALLQDLHAWGVRNLEPLRSQGLGSRQTWTQFLQAYAQIKIDEGQYPLTIEVVYGHAWKAQ